MKVRDICVIRTNIFLEVCLFRLYGHYSLFQEEKIMSKGQDSKKNVKKKPLLTAKEKKAAKQAKKEDNGSILGKH